MSRPRRDSGYVANGNGRRRRRRRRATHVRRRRLLIALLLLAPLLVLVPFIGAGGAAVAVGSDCDLSTLRPPRLGENTFVYAANGTLLGSIPAEKNRQPVKLGGISKWLPQATVAIEDRRFYQHRGVDVEGVVRALWKNVSAGEVVEGGSTITQQLVRNLYISRERTVQRKVKEACLAMKLEQERSKRWILETYLNTVYFGNHAYGVEAAAQTYFSKRVGNLSLPQAALVAGLPQAPTLYDPFRNAKAATRRRNHVLRAMFAGGMITRGEFAAAARTKLNLKAGKLYTRIREPYFFGYVRDELIKAYGAERVRTGGLRVHTTIDPNMQAAARKAMRETLSLKSDPASALIAIDPGTGYIKAMTANTPGKKGNQYNLVAQARRQAGSTFKTFVLAAAVAEGMDPDSTYYVSSPFRYDPKNIDDCEDERVWCVETYSEEYAGSTSVTSATLQSDNAVYAKLTLDVGPEKVSGMAWRLGLGRKLDAYPAIGLGAIEVSPLEMATAYATLAAGGIYSKPLAITRVVFPGGDVDKGERWKPKRKRVISDGVAYEVTKVLEQNMTGGTGTGAYFGRTSAGKTGTTDNHADAWFCGYTPNLMATVWVGHPRAQIPMLDVHGIRVAGGTFPAEIWRKFMEKATEELPAVSWQTPNNWVNFTSWDRKYAGGDDDFDDGSDDDGYDDDDGYENGYDDDNTGYVAPSPAPAPVTRPATTPAPPTPVAPPPTTVAPPPPPPPPLDPPPTEPAPDTP